VSVPLGMGLCRPADVSVIRVDLDARFVGVEVDIQLV